VSYQKTKTNHIIEKHISFNENFGNKIPDFLAIKLLRISLSSCNTKILQSGKANTKKA